MKLLQAISQIDKHFANMFLMQGKLKRNNYSGSAVDKKSVTGCKINLFL